MLPLDGIKVLDFTQALAGPFAGMLLADMGADVIKVEPLTGDHIRPVLSGSFVLAANRNKRSIAIDLRSDVGVGIARQLMENADVLLEAFVPGVMDRLGLGYQVALEINPRIIYCSISGYGQSGPKKSRSGYDACAQAECGIMEATGLDDSSPIRTGTAFVDYSTGMFAAMGVAFAFLGRERSGRGQHIDVSLLDSALSHMSHWVTGYSITGSDPPRSMSEDVPVAPYDIFPTKDTATFIATLRERHWGSLCKALGLVDLVDDPRFNTIEKRAENRVEMLALLRERVREFKSEDLQEKLVEAGVPCAPVNKISQVLKDSHLQARHTIFEQEYPGVGPIKYVRNPIRISGVAFNMRRNAPLIGEHTIEILQELGYGKDETKTLLRKNVVVSAEGERTDKIESH